MRTFDYFFGLRLAILLLGHSDNLSTLFQAENLWTDEAQKIAKSTVITLKKMGSDEKFDLFWKDVKNKAAIFDVDPPRLPRKNRVPARIEEFLGGSATPEFDDDVYLIIEKYTTRPWVVSSMSSKIDLSGRFRNINKIRKSSSQSRKRKRLR